MATSDESAPPGPSILRRDDGATIAYHKLRGKRPGVVFCPGFMSDMSGTKATALESACRSAGRAYVRFDYFGHGLSSGAFTDGTIGRWTEDAIAVLDHVAEGPQVLVGSSMGGWIMLLAALERPELSVGLVGVAPAVDFVEDLMWQAYPAAVKETLEREGVYYEPSEYSDEPYAITMRLIEEGRRHLLLGAPIPIRCPVRLLHGMRDRDVPWEHSLKVLERLDSTDVTLTLVKEGDHRLSEPEDIRRLCETVERLCNEVA